MLVATFKPYTLNFNEPGGTSRGVLTQKPSWFVEVYNKNNPTIKGVGEISVIPKLSPEYFLKTNLEEIIAQKLANINNVDIYNQNEWHLIPAVRFGIETALTDLKNGGTRILYPSLFTKGDEGITINGLVWMGDIATMRRRIIEKYEAGFRCIKLKIGALNFDNELKLVEFVRTEFPDVEIRLDANGAFTPSDALHKIDLLSKYQIHSIEQPIKPNQWKAMADICKQSPIDIALDEELIGIEQNKAEMLNTINPQYIILKPSLVGGLYESEQWIALCQQYGIKWWATSALESNIGLNAIAQWVFTQNVDMPQGLGTGMVYSNNFDSPLKVNNAKLWHTNQKWSLSI